MVLLLKDILETFMSSQPIQYRDLYHDKGINYVLISWFGIHTYI